MKQQARQMDKNGVRRLSRLSSSLSSGRLVPQGGFEMIVRSWSGRAAAAGAESYIAHFRQKVLPDLRRITGHRGAMLLRKGVADEIELVVLTFWDSMASIHEFAGKDVTVAVVEPEAKAVLKAFDPYVQHFDLVLDTRG